MLPRPVPATAGAALLVLCTSAFTARVLTAQTDLTVEIGASQVGPPVGADGESARFGVAGLRASHFGPGGSGVSASILTGAAFGGTPGGDFVTGTLSGTAVGRWTSRWTGSFDLKVLAFGIRAPFPYRAVAFEGGPALAFGSGPVWIKVAALAGGGRSRFEIWRVEGGPTRVFQDGLWRVGGTGELLFGTGPIRAGVAGGVHETPGGSYGSGGVRVLLGGGRGAVEVSADMWRTPLATQTVASLAFAIPLSGWSLRGYVGRSEPDPLTLAEPGSGSGGILLGRSLLPPKVNSELTGGPYTILSRGPDGARLRVTLDPPGEPDEVQLLGDFTLWDGLAMRPRNGRWEIEVVVPVGTHHYGFLVDGEWYVPEDVRDVVPDEWGRTSAILVIEGVE